MENIKNIIKRLNARRDYLKWKLEVIPLSIEETDAIKNEVKGIEYSIAIATMEIGKSLIDEAQDMLNKLGVKENVK